MRRYHLQRRDDYTKYAKIVGQITQLAHRLSLLPPNDPVRISTASGLMAKLYDLAFVPVRTDALSAVQSKITVSAICRRRLAVVMVRLRMSETIKEAVTLIEQGYLLLLTISNAITSHVRVGPTRVTDPAYLVTRKMEDFLTWTPESGIKRKIAKYNDQLDDYDLLADA